MIVSSACNEIADETTDKAKEKYKKRKIFLNIPVVILTENYKF